MQSLSEAALGMHKSSSMTGVLEGGDTSAPNRPNKAHVSDKLKLLGLTGVFLLASTAVALVVLGIFDGFYIGPHASSNAEVGLPDDMAVEFSRVIQPKEEKQSSIKMMLAGTKVDAIKEHMRFLASKPHLSGTQRNEKDVVDYVASVFQKSGLDQVVKIPYSITHTYATDGKPNSVKLLEKDGKVVHEASLHPKKDKNVVSGYLAFSPSGSIKADLVFVNYGRHQDMEKLKEMDVEVKGHICLARYGGAHPVTKAINCKRRGGVGLLVFADPQDVAPDGASTVYPAGVYVDGSALRRGALYHYGDPQTPAYPSVLKALRGNDTVGLPTIPALVIGYDDAAILMESLGGKDTDWKGSLNATYKTGPLVPEGRQVEITVNNKETPKEVYNVIGIIKGKQEQDRFSIAGSHHDSWGYGAQEPSSATAALLELSRVLGTMKKGGWRPRRTIVLASWAAGEMAFAGSSEWVEENLVLLHSGAVGYVNVDSCASGPRFSASASPILRNIIYKAAEQVKSGKKTILEKWQEDEGKKPPNVPLAHAVSDNAPFNFYAGIPSVDFTFRPNENLTSGWFPSYHTAFDTLEMFEKLVDPQYELTLACSQMYGALTLELAEDVVLPYKVTDLAQELRAGFIQLRPIVGDLKQNNITLDWLDKEITQFEKAAKTFQAKIDRGDFKSPSAIRMLNERLVLVERAFIKRDGLLKNQNVRNLAFGPDPENAYEGKAFPFLLEHVFSAKTKESAEEVAKEWQQARMDLDTLTLAVRMGNLLLDSNKLI